MLGLTPAPEGKIQLMRHEGVNPEHAATVDLSRPLLVAHMTDRSGAVVSPMVIDGWHRIWRARKENRAELPAYLLTETMAVDARLPPFDLIPPTPSRPA